MSDPDTEFLRSFYQALEDEPLDWDDPRRVNLYERELVPVDPVVQLERRIQYSALESVQLVSGFRGTGKSTELRRLAHRLREQGALVVLSDMREYLNLEIPLDIGGFLVAIAGAFGEGLASPELLGWDPIKEGYWARFRNFLTRTKVELGALDLAPSGLRGNLRDDPSFLRKLGEAMDGRIGALVRDVREFIASGLAALKARHGDDVQVVFILDSIEHTSVTAQNHQAVTSALERVFTLHADKLRFNYMHLIYTVPPWLKIRSPGVAGLYQGAYLLPCVKVHDHQGNSNAIGIETLARVVAARAPNWARLLGDRATLDRIIALSGGYIRDLFRLLREALVLDGDPLPRSAERLEVAVAEVRNSYLPISHHDAKWLARVARSHESELASDAELPDLSRYFDTHLLLCHRNGTEWYDVHPLIADRVAALAERVAAQEGDDSGR